MQVQRIHIKNFQRHADLKLDFKSDINVITGLTDSGKSGVFRAMEWLFNFSNISESDYRKEGTKETSVKVWLVNDFQVERIRSNTINRYILSKENCEDKIFDSFGKNTPEEIVEVFGINTINVDDEHINLNFASQDQLNFLLDSTYSDTFKAKLFNKLTGNEVLDKAFKELNRENLRFNREIKETEENLVKQEEQLSEYSLSYKKLKKKLCLVTEQYEKIKEEMEIYEHLKNLSEKLKANKEQNEFVNFKTSQIKTISDKKIKELKEQAEQLKQIQELSYELEAINNNLETVKKQKNNIKVVKFDEKQLINKAETLQKMKQLNEELSLNIEQLQTTTIDKKVLKDRLNKSQEELEKIWKEQKICPLCQRKVKERKKIKRIY